MIEELPLCECGCGEKVSKVGNRFIHGHSNRKPKSEVQLCACGCGELTKPGNRFINGHNNRGKKTSDETKEKQSKSHEGHDVSNKTRQKISETNLKEKVPLKGGKKLNYDKIVINKNSTMYLGCYIAEQVLSKVFKDVKIMPFGNHGYDIICNRDKKIDIKSSATGYKGIWQFRIDKNEIPDYYLLIAFDDRNDLNPQYLWLIPKGVIFHLQTFEIAKSKIYKWVKYEQSIDKVITYCDKMKVENK